MSQMGTINLQYTTIKDPLPDFIYKDLERFSRDANAYHPQPQELIEKLAKKHQLPQDMFYLTAGIDEALQMFILTYGDNTIVFTPTYVVYSDVEVLGGKLNRVYSIKDNEYRIDPRKYDEAKLIILANPNNPSGYTEKKRVKELIENNSHAIVVIDEAYGEFADLSVVDFAQQRSHLAVLRSFSKAYGMAGNRVGYIVANPKIIEQVKNKAQWTNISYLSVGAAISALNHEDYFVDMRRDIVKRREKFVSFLKEKGLAVLPSKINAVIIKFESEGKASLFVNYLRENNIIVSQGNGNSNIGLDDSFVRVAIGSEDQMAKVSQVIDEHNR